MRANRGAHARSRRTSHIPPLQVFAEKQLKELKNGRLAMIAVLGELMAQQVSGYGTYEQLGLIIKDLPLPL